MFAADDSAVGKELKMQEVKKLILQGRERGLDGGQYGGLSFTLPSKDGKGRWMTV